MTLVLVHGITPHFLTTRSRGRGRTRFQTVRFVVVDERFLLGIQRQLALQNPRERRRVAGYVRVPHHGGIADGRLAALHTIEKVAGVSSNIESHYAFRGFGHGGSERFGFDHRFRRSSPVSTDPASPTNRTGHVPSRVM